MKITKGDGTEEVFDISKLEHSLKRSGALQAVAEDIAQEVERGLVSGMTTTEIYKKAYALLKKREGGVAARYSMRRAILDLGPSGYPFEDFFAELMRARGYAAAVRQEIEGRCATHEVDVVLTKTNDTGDRAVGAELKFHNRVGFKTDLKTALYVSARFKDIEEGAKDRGDVCPITEGWLVTNTKFTSRAIRYAECSGLTVLGWSYPKENNLSNMIEESGLYPVTVLRSLTKAEKTRLLSMGVSLCKHLLADPNLLTQAGVPNKKHNKILEESGLVCNL